MSVTPMAGPVLAPAARRVRHQARDAAVLMVFSAVTSVGIASGFLLLSQLGR
jgi:hypothetical protein